MFPTFIEALVYIASKLEDESFGVVEEPPTIAGHGLQYGIHIEAGPTWIVYRPNAVSYWIVVQAD